MPSATNLYGFTVTSKFCSVESHSTIGMTSYKMNVEGAFQRLMADIDIDEEDLEENVNKKEVAGEVF